MFRKFLSIVLSCLIGTQPLLANIASDDQAFYIKAHTPENLQVLNDQALKSLAVSMAVAGLCHVTFPKKDLFESLKQTASTQGLKSIAMQQIFILPF